MLAQPDTELREPWHNGEDQVSGSDTVVGTHNASFPGAETAFKIPELKIDDNLARAGKILAGELFPG